MKTLKHGIEIRFGKGRSLKILSYAVFVNGNRHVDHATTRANRLNGVDLMRSIEIEKSRDPSLKVI